MLVDDTKNLPSTYDFIIVFGVFDNKRYNNEEFMLETISATFNVCRLSIALNAISTYVDYEDNNFFSILQKNYFLTLRRISVGIQL